jgi:hypothetical protein
MIEGVSSALFYTPLKNTFYTLKGFWQTLENIFYTILLVGLVLTLLKGSGMHIGNLVGDYCIQTTILKTIRDLT